VPDAELTTMLLRRLAGGDQRAAEELLPLVYGDLHELAAAYMSGEREQHTLQPTALIHEAWLRLVAADQRGFENRAHFFALAARAMRQVLIDHARRRGAEKRGGRLERVPIDAALELYSEGGPDLVVLDEALRRLEALDPELVRIVELRFFAGASNPEIAAALGVSTRTVERGWKTAQSWLREELGRAEAAES
jgi:RNA polymerase sigma factor (TIGR02999 family)